MILIMFLFLIIIRKVFVMSIPKIIHYCWVGNSEKPKSVLKCIESWKKFCPGYEIKEWNESNYDFSKNEYMRQAYEAKKWGFVPDYARLDIIYNYGGIYLDTDVEIIKSFDELLKHKSFFGFEDTGEGTYFIACGLGFGSVAKNSLVKELRDYYNNKSFYLDDGNYDLMPAPRHNVKVFSKYGVVMNNQYQTIGDNIFYPSEYFCPKIFKTNELKITPKTFSIHQFDASWLDKDVLSDIKHSQKIKKIFGPKLGGKILYIESVFKKYSFVKIIKIFLIKIYEYLYYWFPLIKARIINTFKKRNNDKIVIFDTAMNTKNQGDFIIMDNCIKNLKYIIDINKAEYVSTHILPQNDFYDSSLKFLCGTNALSGDLKKYGLWKIPHNLLKYNNIILFGVGFDTFSKDSTYYTRALLKTILKKNAIHSVRDSFSEKKLKSMGIKSVLNTCCPTMWGLTPEHCKNIPQEKSDKVISTITDYLQDFENDKKMLDILTECYDTVYLWLQGDGDKEYLNKLGYSDKVIIIDNNLKAYDNVLENKNVDYVGTRLHAGIRALSYKRRSLIISIDNRAECIASDTGLPILKRKDICELKNIITGKIQTAIKLPVKNIETWKAQFNKEQ
ncbi:MAG: hypothetical protein EGR46_07675 [Ruminococcus sp.]|nr:hypothetical protein [Ruminococcus sp.]